MKTFSRTHTGTCLETRTITKEALSPSVYSLHRLAHFLITVVIKRNNKMLTFHKNLITE